MAAAKKVASAKKPVSSKQASAVAEFLKKKAAPMPAAKAAPAPVVDTDNDEE